MDRERMRDTYGIEMSDADLQEVQARRAQMGLPVPYAEPREAQIAQVSEPMRRHEAMMASHHEQMAERRRRNDETVARTRHLTDRRLDLHDRYLRLRERSPVAIEHEPAGSVIPRPTTNIPLGEFARSKRGVKFLRDENGRLALVNNAGKFFEVVRDESGYALELSPVEIEFKPAPGQEAATDLSLPADASIEDTVRASLNAIRRAA